MGPCVVQPGRPAAGRACVCACCVAWEQCESRGDLH